MGGRGNYEGDGGRRLVRLREERKSLFHPLVSAALDEYADLVLEGEEVE